MQLSINRFCCNNFKTNSNYSNNFKKYDTNLDLKSSDFKHSNSYEAELKQDIPVQDLIEKARCENVGNYLRKQFLPEEIKDKVFFMLNDFYGINTSSKTLSDSSGDEILTDEQIKNLKEKYNVNNLSMQEQYDLLCDLTNLNIISKDDALSVYLEVCPSEFFCETSKLNFFDSSDQFNLISLLSKRINNEKLVYDDKNISIQGLNMDSYSTVVKSHQKVLDVLNKLKQSND